MIQFISQRIIIMVVRRSTIRINDLFERFKYRSNIDICIHSLSKRAEKLISNKTSNKIISLFDHIRCFVR